MKTSKRLRNWLKVLVSLVVVMGLTWVSGVLIVEVEELLPLAYIFTIMVAFQGVWIFLLFVPLQENVRDAYVKLWKTTRKASGKQKSYLSEKTSSVTVIMVKLL